MKSIFACILAMILLTACNNQISIKSGDNEMPKSGETNNEAVIDDNLSKGEFEDEVNKYISEMSLEDKIEQMLILDYSHVAYGVDESSDVTKLSNSAKTAIENHSLGGIILFADNTKGTRQTLELVSDFQMAATTNNRKYKIPLFMCVDQEGGRVNRINTGTSLPGNMALGAINDYNTTVEYSEIIGKELSALGFNLDFAPVLDINNNPSNPIIGVRSFSSNTEIASRIGQAFIEGLHNYNIISTLKHFPGHGDTGTDSHTGLPIINKSYDEINEEELVPFKAGITKGADMIMTAHILYPQIEKTKYISKKTGEEITLPATLSKTILTDILRNELGFDGVIITDALNMGAITAHFDKKDVVKYALNAGVDILLMPISLLDSKLSVDEYVQIVVDLVKEGEISESTINESVKRILTLKYKMELFNKDYELNDEAISYALSVVGSKENHDKELEICKKAITLVKGDELLPLKKSERVLILNAYANENNNMQYAIELLKEDNILGSDFKYEIDSYENKSLNELKDKINNASVVIITTDTYGRAYFDNTNAKNGWQGRFIDDAIKEVHNQNKKVVLISCMLPYDVARYEAADIILCAYGERSITNLPILYDGETKTFGQNMTAAIIKLFDGSEFNSKLPVEIYKIDKNYNYTDQIWTN